MQVTAQLKNLRIAPRKTRLVSGFIKGMDVLAAKSQLDHLIKKSSKPISKLLDSAVANARNNFGLVKENLFIKDIIVGEGMKLKRFRPKGFGSTSPIQKKTSSIKIILEERVPGLKAVGFEKKERVPTREASRGSSISQSDIGTGEKRIEAAVPEKEVKTETREKARPEVKKEIGKKGFLNRITKRFFRRKAI